MRYVEPASRSMRRAMSMASESLNADGAERSALSIDIPTSALLRAGRLLVPEKITSSIEEARMDLYEDSPITQRSASTRLDLPQPFGTTTPVSPGSIRKTVASTHDVNGIMRRAGARGRAWCCIWQNRNPVQGIAPKAGWLVLHRPENESPRPLEQQGSGGEAWFSRPFGLARLRNGAAAGSAPRRKTLIRP